MTKSSQIVVGFWRRFFADFLDAMVLAIPGYGVGYLFRYSFSEMGLRAVWIGVVCSLLYYGLLHTRLGGGQTPGKRLLGIQVLRRDGQYLDFGRSFLRYLVVSFIFYNGLYGSLLNHLPPSAMMAVGSVYILVIIWAFFACFLMIPFHPLKRGLHDLAADSVVVYKDCFDSDELDRLDDPSKARRALAVLSVGSCLFAGACVFGLLKLTSGSEDMAKLTEIQKFVGTEYDVPQVTVNHFNGKATSLAVVLHVPLASFENKAEKERIRQEVFNKTKARFNDLERFGTLKIVMSSGYDIGIASYFIRD
ncbi:RDD family protein [Geomonas oryzisoli]|uniref:RDD family protein n=1 Tax=Geomonas oryzisoli TaxID=2847992 RepID=A0ABX8JAX0_9BACT|nr:RDD family protein [Geomonas oryzisoli]QWV94286.1 RDD family protein [Geomonas oryzisoli]